MRCLQLQSIQTRQQLNSPSKITFPFPPKTFSKQALVHNSQFTTLQLQNRNSNKTLNRYLCQLLKRKTLSNSPIIPSNSNSNSHISLFQIKKPKSLSLSLSLLPWPPSSPQFPLPVTALPGLLARSTSLWAPCLLAKPLPFSAGSSLRATMGGMYIRQLGFCDFARIFTFSDV